MKHKFELVVGLRIIAEIEADTPTNGADAVIELLEASQLSQDFLDGFNENGAGRRGVRVNRFEFCWDEPVSEGV